MDNKLELVFYRCNRCGNITVMLKNSGVVPECCGDPMERLVPETMDAIAEKHVPMAVKNGNRIRITVGSVPHPMTDIHRIEWIILQTDNGFCMARLEKTGEPTAEFVLAPGASPVAAYEYCNLHGLWKMDF